MNQSVGYHSPAFKPVAPRPANFLHLTTEFMAHNQWRRPPYACLSEGFQFRTTYTAVGYTNEHFSVRRRRHRNVFDLKLSPGRVVQRLHFEISVVSRITITHASA